MGILVVFLLVSAAALTVMVAQQQQTFKQRASSLATPPPPDCGDGLTCDAVRIGEACPSTDRPNKCLSSKGFGNADKINNKSLVCCDGPTLTDNQNQIPADYGLPCGSDLDCESARASDACSTDKLDKCLSSKGFGNSDTIGGLSLVCCESNTSSPVPTTAPTCGSLGGECYGGDCPSGLTLSTVNWSGCDAYASACCVPIPTPTAPTCGSLSGSCTSGDCPSGSAISSVNWSGCDAYQSACCVPIPTPTAPTCGSLSGSCTSGDCPSGSAISSINWSGCDVYASACCVPIATPTAPTCGSLSGFCSDICPADTTAITENYSGCTADYPTCCKYTSSITPIPGPNDTIIEFDLPNGAFNNLFKYSTDTLPITTKEQELTMYLYKSTDDPKKDPKGEKKTAKDNKKITYSATGTVSFDLGKVIKGTYKILLKSPKYLRAMIAEDVDIKGTGETIKITSLKKSLVDGAGDVNDDNVLNILDYNMILGCHDNNTLPCINKTAADLNDNGVIDGIDDNIFIKSLSFKTREGD
jgi:hypothetical protein